MHLLVAVGKGTGHVVVVLASRRPCTYKADSKRRAKRRRRRRESGSLASRRLSPINFQLVSRPQLRSPLASRFTPADEKLYNVFRLKCFMTRRRGGSSLRAKRADISTGTSMELAFLSLLSSLVLSFLAARLFTFASFRTSERGRRKG